MEHSPSAIDIQTWVESHIQNCTKLEFNEKTERSDISSLFSYCGKRHAWHARNAIYNIYPVFVCACMKYSRGLLEVKALQYLGNAFSRSKENATSYAVVPLYLIIS